MLALSRSALLLSLCLAVMPFYSACADGMGFAAMAMPKSMGNKKRIFNKINRIFYQQLRHAGLEAANNSGIPGLKFPDLKIKCPSARDREYLGFDEEITCRRLRESLTASRKKAPLARFFSEKYDDEGVDYLEEVAYDNKVGAIVSSSWVLFGEKTAMTEMINKMGNESIIFEIRIWAYLRDNSATQLKIFEVRINRDMSFDYNKVTQQFSESLTELFKGLVGYTKRQGTGFKSSKKKPSSTGDEDF